jgi:hypothetical protein
MQQFTVPQFIDVEDKIIGPITTRQFSIMLTGFILIGISYKLFDFSLFVTVSVLIFAIFGMFAFLKINGMPFHFFILNFLQTLKKPSLRVWNLIDRESEVDEDNQVVAEKKEPLPPPKLYTASRLTELSLTVDTEGVYREE